MVPYIAMMLTLAMPSADPPPRPDGTDMWAVGYAITIVRTCPSWAMEQQEQLYRKGILPKAAFGSPQWLELEDSLQKGIAAAEATRSSHPRLCDDLPAINEARWKRLSPILKQAAKQPSDHQ